MVGFNVVHHAIDLSKKNFRMICISLPLYVLLLYYKQIKLGAQKLSIILDIHIA